MHREPPSLAILSHPLCREHETGAGHPERPERLDALAAALRAAPFAAEPKVTRHEAREATRTELERVHEPSYLDLLFARAPREGLAWLDADTPIGPHSLGAALCAAGAVAEAVDRVLGGETRAAFCPVRPPGHHAERARAMGFCLLNNVAVGAAHALEAHGLERVAIVDFDVHHGNGTEDIFRDEPRVLLLSSFQHPFYPGSGADTRSDHILNLPLPAGTDGPAYRRQVEARWLGPLDAFRPELVLFSAGFDAHREDPLAGLLLEDDDFAWITTVVRDLALRHAGGRIVSTLEGGYSREALGRSAVAHLEALCGEEGAGSGGRGRPPERSAQAQG